MYNVPYHNCIYNRLPEDEPSGSKHVEDIKKIKNLNINLGNMYFVGLYCIMTKVTEFLKVAKVENISF